MKLMWISGQLQLTFSSLFSLSLSPTPLPSLYYGPQRFRR
jgi:hypothetical protein